MRNKVTGYRVQGTGKQRGFTLIELMVAVVIVGVIFGTVITATSGINRRNRDSHRQSDMQNLQDALSQYYADNHSYPQTAVFNPLLTSGAAFTGPLGRTYMGHTPVDPVGAPRYCYISQVSKTVAGACDNSVNSTLKCEYYMLCASLEDPQTGATPCTCNGTPYNMSVQSP